MRPTLFLATLLLAFATTAQAQVSANFVLEEHSFNSGGAPTGGVPLSSPSFSITLASIGDTLAATGLSSSSFVADVGFGTAYPPPGEVKQLVLTDKQTLVWNAHQAAGVYNLYRDDQKDGYGECEQHDLTTATTADAATPPSGAVFHYLVTVENRLAEEGTKGFTSDSTERLGGFDLPACP